MRRVREATILFPAGGGMWPWFEGQGVQGANRTGTRTFMISVLLGRGPGPGSIAEENAEVRVA